MKLPRRYSMGLQRSAMRGSSLLLCALAVLSPMDPQCLAADPRAAEAFDVLIRGGLVYDGSGKPPRRADVGIKGDRIIAIGDLGRATAKTVVDAADQAVAPGFINMLSWSNDSLLADGRGQSEIRQG